MRTSHKWMLRGIVILAMSVGAVGLLGATVETTFSAQGLRCEYLSNPMGIDVEKPRLNWLLNPAENVHGQSAYRVLVARGPAGEWRYHELGGLDGPSHIHDTLISIGAWFTEGLAGIRSDGKSPGFQHFIVKPAVVGDLTFVKARYRSIHGDIVCDWRIENGTFRLSVTVPPGTTATVFVPGDGPVRTKAQPSSSAGNRGFEVTPGTHLFEAALQPNR